MKDLRLEESKEILEFAKKAHKYFTDQPANESEQLYRNNRLGHDVLLAIKWNNVSVVVVRIQGEAIHLLNSDLENFDIKDLRT